MVFDYGKANDVPELVDAKLSLDGNTGFGHQIAMVATGISNANAYYLISSGNIGVFLVIQDDTFPKPHSEILSAHAVTMFAQFIQGVPITNHKDAFVSYMEFYDASIDDKNDTVVGRFKDGSRIEARFLPDGGLKNVTVQGGGGHDSK